MKHKTSENSWHSTILHVLRGDNNLKNNRPSLNKKNVELSFLHSSPVTGKHWNKSCREFYLRTRHANISAMAWGSLVAFNRSGRLPNNLPDLWLCARTSWALHSGCGNVIQDLVKATCLKNRFFSIYIHEEVFKQGGSPFKNVTIKRTISQNFFKCL